METAVLALNFWRTKCIKNVIVSRTYYLLSFQTLPKGTWRNTVRTAIHSSTFTTVIRVGSCNRENSQYRVENSGVIRDPSYHKFVYLGTWLKWTRPPIRSNLNAFFAERIRRNNQNYIWALSLAMQIFRSVQPFRCTRAQAVSNPGCYG